MLVFGYGSLVDRDSLEASLGRALDPADGPFPLRLTDADLVRLDDRERSYRPPCSSIALTTRSQIARS